MDAAHEVDNRHGHYAECSEDDDITEEHDEKEGGDEFDAVDDCDDAGHQEDAPRSDEGKCVEVGSGCVNG